MNALLEAPAGICYGMDIAEYHARPGLSASGMTDLARSPAHYYALHLAPERPPRPEKPGQLEGNLAHCAILEPSEFGARYAVGPDCRRGTKAWEAWEAGETRKAIKREQRDVALAQAASVFAVPDLRTLFEIGNPEVSAFWNDPITGVPCRCRPDWCYPVGNRAVILVDVKTVPSAEPSEFARHAAKKGWHRQAAHYSDGFTAATGMEVDGFVFAPVECSYPFAASAVMLDDESLDRGRAECRRLIDTYAECMRTGHWPGYPGTVQSVSLPAWAFTTTETTE